MSRLTESPAWKALESHRDELRAVHMRDLFAADPRRIAARADILSQRLAYPRKRMLGWAAAHAALSACWDLADGTPITGLLACLPNLLSAYDQA